MYIIVLIIQFYFCRYRRKRDKLIERAAAAPIPTMWGPFTAHCYKSILDGIEHIAMVKVRNDCSVFTYFFSVATGTK